MSTLRALTMAAVLSLGLYGCSSAPPRPAPSSDTEPDITVHLLGTGGPELSTMREGMSTLIEIGDRKLLFDAGRGSTQNMYESRVNPADVTTVFLTHLHNDHYEDLSSLWLNPWFMLGRTDNLRLWGPEGTAGMVEGMRDMYAHDLEKRSNDKFRKEDLDIDVTEVEPGVVYDEGGVKVAAFTVEHKDGDPSFGYRIDYKDRSVLLSGDTTYNDNVVEHGKGVNVLVHNVVAFSEELTASGELKSVEEKLTTPEQAAEVFSRTEPRVAVYSHIAKKDLHGEEGDEVILDRTRAAGYDGPLHMGVDRMSIEVGDEVTVTDPASTEDLPDLDGPGVDLSGS